MRKKIYTWFWLGCLMLLQDIAYAQQMPKISNFMNNQLIFNPAAAGMHETDLNVGALSLLQWSGVDGAPTYHMFWSDFKFDAYKSAVGLNVNRYSFGVNQISDVQGNYSYYIRITPTLKLSMGLRAGASFIRSDALPTERIWDAGDAFEQASLPNTTLPVFGTGFRLSNEKFYAAISSPDVVIYDRYDVYRNKDKSFFSKTRNYILMGGYVFPLSDGYQLKPNIMFSYFNADNYRADFNVNFEIKDYFWAGLTYSTNKFQSLLVGTHVSPMLKASYAFHFGLGSNVPAQFLTHEICLKLNLDVLKK